MYYTDIYIESYSVSRILYRNNRNGYNYKAGERRWVLPYFSLLNSCDKKKNTI